VTATDVLVKRLVLCGSSVTATDVLVKRLVCIVCRRSLENMCFYLFL